jgi:hypothetical protein
VPGAACDNCETVLIGEYCHVCGQHRLQGNELTVRHALSVASSDVLHLESKTLRSMLLLFRPGWLAAEYLAGRRARYTSPLKLYFACAGIFFVFAAITGISFERLMEDPMFAQIVNADIAARNIPRSEYAVRFDARVQGIYTLSLGASVLGGAGMLALLFRRQRRPFGAHIVFELYYVSFLYVVTLVLGGLFRLLPRHPVTSLVVLLAVLGPYLYLSIRRVYAEPGRPVAWKAAVMILFGLLFDSLVNITAMLITMKVL